MNDNVCRFSNEVSFTTKLEALEYLAGGLEKKHIEAKKEADRLAAELQKVREEISKLS